MTTDSNHSIAAFNEVITNFGPALQRLCRGYEINVNARAELRQEILLQLWRALDTYRGDASLRTFVFRVAHNTAIKHISKNARRTPSDDIDVDTLGVTSDTEAQFDRERARARLLAEIQRLAPESRELKDLVVPNISEHPWQHKKAKAGI